MAKLNQIIAVEKSVKSRAHAEITESHQQLLKPALLAGLSRSYRPKDEDGERVPPEATRVQLRADEVIKRTAAALTELFDVTATKDYSNCEARADVIVDGNMLIAKAPVTYLLFLEKQLVDIHTFVKKLPVLDPSESWIFDPAQDCYATEASETLRTKKVPRNHVKAEATEKHPAQVEVYYEDITVGSWRTVKFSGALPARRVAELLERVEKLQRAVKFAREEANNHEATQHKIGEAVFSFLFK
jgi:hypothetical protein